MHKSLELLETLLGRMSLRIASLITLDRTLVTASDRELEVNLRRFLEVAKASPGTCLPPRVTHALDCTRLGLKQLEQMERRFLISQDEAMRMKVRISRMDTFYTIRVDVDYFFSAWDDLRENKKVSTEQLRELYLALRSKVEEGERTSQSPAERIKLVTAPKPTRGKHRQTAA